MNVQETDETLRVLSKDQALTQPKNARHFFDLMKYIIAYLSWENHWAKAGGLFAVADNLAGYLSHHGEVLIVSPLHRLLRTAPSPSDLKRIETAKPVITTFEGRDVEVRLFEACDRARYGNHWILMESTGFFEADGGKGGTSPYVYSCRYDGWEDPLLRDSLFASAAVPRVLAGLGKTQNVVFHANDWEFATTALTVNLALQDGTLESAVVALTLHNLFDRALPPAALQAITGHICKG